MEKAINYHLNKEIIKSEKLTGGLTFQTYLLTLCDGCKVVFRGRRSFTTFGGRFIDITEVLTRERFFYENINASVGKICPEVYVIDGSLEYHDTPFCIMEYLEGVPLDRCYGDFDKKTKEKISCKIGEQTAKINQVKIDSNHPYMTQRGKWEDYMAGRISERLVPHIEDGLVTQEEAEIITKNMRSKSVENTDSFIHLDMRHVNMIYDNGNIYVIDAENCEFGDPLWEITSVETGGQLVPEFIAGYGGVDTDNIFYKYYLFERRSLVLNIYRKFIKSDTEGNAFHYNEFMKNKDFLLKDS